MPEIFIPRIHEAISNAEAARDPEERYSSGLGTDVYKLVRKLIK